VPEVEQITFNGELASRRGQRVLYVTERAVFELTVDGLELIEVAPGIDIERQILALIPFPVRVRQPRLMNARLFAHKPMGLARLLEAPGVEGAAVEELAQHRKVRALSPSPLPLDRAAVER